MLRNILHRGYEPLDENNLWLFDNMNQTATFCAIIKCQSCRQAGLPFSKTGA